MVLPSSLPPSGRGTAQGRQQQEPDCARAAGPKQQSQMEQHLLQMPCISSAGETGGEGCIHRPGGLGSQGESNGSWSTSTASPWQ